MSTLLHDAQALCLPIFILGLPDGFDADRLVMIERLTRQPARPLRVAARWRHVLFPRPRYCRRVCCCRRKYAQTTVLRAALARGLWGLGAHRHTVAAGSCQHSGGSNRRATGARAHGRMKRPLCASRFAGLDRVRWRLLRPVSRRPASKRTLRPINGPARQLAAPAAARLAVPFEHTHHGWRQWALDCASSRPCGPTRIDCVTVGGIRGWQPQFAGVGPCLGAQELNDDARRLKRDARAAFRWWRSCNRRPRIRGERGCSQRAPRRPRFFCIAL